MLSVFAQHIHCILSAIAERAKRFVFEGQEINLVLSCGIFITLNPGRKYLMTVFMRRMGFMFVKCNEVWRVIGKWVDNTKVLLMVYGEFDIMCCMSVQINVKDKGCSINVLF